MNKNPITRGILSESAKQKNDYEVTDTSGKPIIDTLTPVKGDPEVVSRYNAQLFPLTDRKKIKYAGAPARADYADLIPNLALTSFQISKVFGLLQFIASQAGTLEDYEPEELNNYLNQVLKSFPTMPDEKDMREFYLTNQKRISSGSSHIIAPSERYTGGMDIKFVGALSSEPSGIIFPSAQRQIIADPSSSEYEQAKYGHYVTDLAQKAIRAGILVQEYLMSGAKLSLKEAHKRKVVAVPFDFDFKQINSLVSSTLGIRLEEDLVQNLPVTMHNLDYSARVLVMFDPAQNLTKNHKTAITTNTTPDDNSEHMTSEFLSLKPKLSLSFELNLRPEEVTYMCQSETGEFTYYCLDTWVRSWTSAMVRVKGAAKTLKSVSLVPRFTLPISKTSVLKDVRIAEDYYIDEGRIDENDITVSPTGSIKYVPKPEDMSYENTEAYEQDLDNALRSHFEKGITYNIDKNYSFEDMVQLGDNDSVVQLGAAKDRVRDHSGALLGFDWDLNVMVTAGIANPSQQQTVRLTGAVKPDALTIAEYLGFDWAEEGEATQKNSFINSLTLMGLSTRYSDEESNKQSKGSAAGETNGTPNWILDDPMVTLLKTYAYTRVLGVTRPVSALVNQAMKELDIPFINDSDYDKGLYSKVLAPNGNLIEGDSPDTIVETVSTLLSDAAMDASGTGQSNLLAIALQEDGSAGLESVRDNPRYFHPARSPMSDFGNLYSYVGGYVFKLVCEELLKVPKKTFIERPHIAENEILLPAFSKISNDVIPLAVMFTKYVPDAEAIFSEAEAIIESFEPDDSLTAEDIQVPGTTENAQMFPHQIDGHKVLRKRPKFAILDVAPGGGKTITLLADIACCVAESDIPIMPLVIAPNGLVANWCEDMAKIAGDNWNMVPITTNTWNRWGPERLQDLINEAPPNTIYVASISAIGGKAAKVSYGTRQIVVSGISEFLKKAGFNYIALDESHKAKNPDSGINFNVKSLTTLNHVLYVRLATGTLVTNRIPDVIGQAALLSPHIFRTPQYFSAMFDHDVPDAPHRVRSKLSKHCAIVSKRRKHWAFMLPMPVDTAIKVDLVDPSNPGSELHGQVYQAILSQVSEELQAALKKKPKDGEEDDDAGRVEEGTDDFAEDDDDDDFSKLEATTLNRNIQRLERIILDPNSDESFRMAAENAGIRNFVSNKIKATIDRLDVHFQTVEKKIPNRLRIYKWTKGETYQELDLVEYEGLTYLARKQSTVIERESLKPSILPPPEDKDMWKVETRGKVIIFCRYKNSVDAVYNALPPKYKSMAVKLYSGIADRDQNLQDFKFDPDVKILVANEQSITEGHNLQMASRIIRVEHPWTPGDYDQSTARIFRPDPAASKLDADGKPGDMPRELIMIDWVMTNETLEVPKIARLMQKTVEKTRFDEKGNSHYDSLLTMENFTEEDQQILSVPIKMNLDKIIEVQHWDDYVPHFQLKSEMNSLESIEFNEMRKTTVATMQALPVVPAPSTFGKLDRVPFMPNQRIAKPTGFDIERVSEYIQKAIDDRGRKGAEPLNKSTASPLLLKQPVLTEFGKGIITGFTVSNVTVDGVKQLNPDKPITTLVIKYTDGTVDTAAKPISTFIASNIDESLKGAFGTAPVKGKPKAKVFPTKEDKDRLNATRAKEEKARKKRDKEDEAFETGKTEKVTEAIEVGRRGDKRRENIANGRPVNEGVINTDDPKDAVLPIVPKPRGVKLKAKPTTGDKSINIIPTVYDGFIAIHVNNDDDDAFDLTSQSFTKFDEFVYIESTKYGYLVNQIGWLEDYLASRNMSLDTKSEDRLFEIQDAFEHYKTGGFNLKLAVKVQSELPRFYTQRHREIKNTKKAKIYTQVLPDRVRMVADLRTNKELRKLIGKAVPSSGGQKWKHHVGMHVYMTTSKADAKSKIQDLVDAGYTVKNLEKVLTAITKLKVLRKAK